MRVLSAIFLALYFPCIALGQQPCTVPVSVRTLDLSLIPTPARSGTISEWDKTLRSRRVTNQYNSFDVWRLAGLRVVGLGNNSFDARDRDGPLPVLSVEPDRRQQRVVLVVENGIRMTSKAREIASMVITDILSNAGENVSFALVTALGPRIAFGIGSSRSKLRAVAQGLSEPPQSLSKGRSVLDALTEATRLLQPHEPGDSIFVIAMRLEEENLLPWPLSGLGVFGVGRRGRATFKTVGRAVAASHIRVFGVQLGRVYPPNQLSNISCTGPDPSSSGSCETLWEDSAWNQLFLLGMQSRGGAVSENTQAFYGRMFLLKPNGLLGLEGAKSSSLITHAPTVKEMATGAEQVYELMTSGYLIHLAPAGPRLSVTLSRSSQLQIPSGLVLPSDNTAGFECLH